MHRPCEPLSALGLQGFNLGQSILGTWVNAQLTATLYGPTNWADGLLGFLDVTMLGTSSCW